MGEPIDLDALEQLAKAATPGPWHQDERNPERIETAGLRLVAISNAWPSGQVRIDGAYLASLSPDRVLSLIERLERAEESACLTHAAEVDAVAAEEALAACRKECDEAQAQASENLRLWQLALTENDRKAVRIRELEERLRGERFDYVDLARSVKQMENTLTHERDAALVRAEAAEARLAEHADGLLQHLLDEEDDPEPLGPYGDLPWQEAGQA